MRGDAFEERRQIDEAVQIALDIREQSLLAAVLHWLRRKHDATVPDKIVCPGIRHQPFAGLCLDLLLNRPSAIAGDHQSRALRHGLVDQLDKGTSLQI